MQGALNIQDIWANDLLTLHFPDPLIDPRVPDIIALTKPGTIYSSSTSKIAEHGGFSDQDVNVPIIISNPRLSPQAIKAPVQTAQIAPTILTLLGLDPLGLQAVQIEHTKVLPAFDPAEIAVTSSTTPSKLSSTVQLMNGQSQFQLSAEAGETFTIEASTDLENWAPIGTNAVTVGGSALVTDPDASSYPNRFYRAVAR